MFNFTINPKYAHTSKISRVLMLIALFFSTMCTMGDLVIVPITAKFYEIVENELIANMIVTGPALTGMFFCYLGGWMADRYNKKTMMVFGFALFTLSGIFGATSTNPIYMMIMRNLCTGVAWGFTCTAAVAIIADIYVKEDERGKIIGWYNMVMAGCGAILVNVAGRLAASQGWQAAFKTYYLAVPILVILILCVPNMPVSKASVKKEENVAGKVAVSSSYLKKIIPVCLIFFMFAISSYVSSYMIALYVAETQIGDEVFISSVSTVATVASLVANFAFGFVYSKLKNKTAFPSYIIITLAFIALYLFPAKGTVFAVNLIKGIGWGVLYSFFFTVVTVIAPEGTQGKALGWLNIANGFAAFACSYYITLLKGILGTNSTRETFLPMAVILAIVSVGAIIFFLRLPGAEKEEGSAAEV